MPFRLRIREQLCLLISFACILAIVVLAVSTWYQSRHYLEDSRKDLLGTIANVKASQISQNVGLMNDAVQSVSTRDMLQASVHDYNNGNDSDSIIEVVEKSLGDALNGGIEQPLLLQAAIFPLRNASGENFQAIANVTAKSALGKLLLPYSDSNGSAVYLGEGDIGYPPQLYPNFTSISQVNNGNVIMYDDKPIYYNTTVLLGPLVLQGNASLISMTIAINNNTTRGDVIGWLTIVLNASSLYDTVQSRVGLGDTGEVVLVGPARTDNKFTNADESQALNGDGSLLVQFVLPPFSKNHPLRAENKYLSFPMKDYPAVYAAYSEQGHDVYTIDTLISTHNEENVHIATGYADVPSDIVDWVLVFEQAHSEVVSPIDHLRDTILICAFSVLAGILVICFPLAHYAVRPIIALRRATRETVVTYETPIKPEDQDPEKGVGPENNAVAATENEGHNDPEKRSERKLSGPKVREFHIPEKVPVTRHVIHDELTDLTSTFNEMTDELSIQYSKLEERVRARTVELEESRNEAQVANESKTLFIANVSHELRTPLNGIIGMCAVAMQEEEMARVRSSLKIIYKSSDLLLHLLNDLLTFSSSSYGQNLAIEENAFRLGDIGTQLVSIFEKRAADANISLRVLFVGQSSVARTDPEQDGPEDAIAARSDVSEALQRVRTEDFAQGPLGTGPLRMIGLRGDKHRILQILMNLVSNSLKFTPAKGAIEVRVKYRETIEYDTMCQASDTNTITPTTPLPQTPNLTQNEIGYMAVIGNRPRMLFDFEVEDTGTGVPEHLQQEIFKPFVQGDAALSKKHGGTGLGLAICAQLAQLMGGKMSLKSNVGIGSTFTLSIPLQYTKEQVPSVSGSLARPGSGKAASLASSMQRGDLSTRSLRTQVLRSGHRSAKTSLYSQDRDVFAAPTPLGDLLERRSVRFDDSKSDTVVRDSTSRNKMGTNNEYAKLEVIPSISVSQTSESEIDNNLLSAPPRPSRAGKEKQPATPKSKSKTSSKVDPRRVLVAEDNAVNQQVILRLLKLEGVSDVVVAENGEEALNAVKTSLQETEDQTSKQQPFSLILMDVQMPKMDGIESTKHIRALGFEGPIVALTAFDHETNRTACKEVGMNGFLGKPIKRTVLKKTLEEFNGSSKPPDDAEKSGDV